MLEPVLSNRLLASLILLTALLAAAHLQIEEAALAAVCICEAPITADLAQARKTGCGIERIERAA